MLETVSTLEHLGIHARDGDIGRVGDVLFDDQTWTVRYLVVRTGGWLRHILGMFAGFTRYVRGTVTVEAEAIAVSSVNIFLFAGERQKRFFKSGA